MKRLEFMRPPRTAAEGLDRLLRNMLLTVAAVALVGAALLVHVLVTRGSTP